MTGTAALVRNHSSESHSPYSVARFDRGWGLEVVVVRSRERRGAVSSGKDSSSGAARGGSRRV
jgi:hypothetical protein